MTNNMKKMFNDIMCALYQCFPEEHVAYCFSEGYPLNSMQYGIYILLEFVKYSYFSTLEKHPLRYYLNYAASDDTHSERMRYSRSLKYTQKYKDINYDLLIKWPGINPQNLEFLLQKDMSIIPNRIEGYELTKMDIFEQVNIQDLRIIKAIVEKRIYSSKKVSNSDFIEMMREYDNWV